MKREKIELSEHICRSLIDEEYDNYKEGEDLGFSFINEVVSYTDMEKAYKNKDVIIMRNLDHKYFKFDYVDSNYRYLFEDTTFPLTAIEVFPKTVTNIIYE